MILGGLGDQFIFNYLEVHLNYLGNPQDSELLRKAESLSMHMLHSTGGGLMSVGVSMFAINHFGVRRNQSWAKWTFIVVVLIAQGINGYGMYLAGSHYWYPILVLTLALLGFGFLMIDSENNIENKN